jgi:long-chain acyl-CoA synthetase
MPTDTIPARLLAHAAARPTAPALLTRRGDAWEAISYGEYGALARQIARALLALGLEPAGRACILGANRAEWVLFDVGTMLAGGVPAGIYETCSAEEVGWIVAHAEAKVVLVEDHAQWEKVAACRASLPALRAVVWMRGAPPVDDPLVLSWEAFLARGDAVDGAAVDARLEAAGPQDMATFIYTSGTTGPPKAVMLSHHNLTWTADAAIGIVSLGPNDRLLSYLPLSHIAEQMFSIHGPITAGAPVYFARSRETLVDDMKSVQPTVFFGVPRVWEKVQARLATRIAELKGPKARLFAWARGVGAAWTAGRAAGEVPGFALRAQYALANKLVFSKIKGLGGLGAVRVCVSGAAPISAEVLRFLGEVDILVHEVYGQSEGSGPTSFNLPGRVRFGTVGQAVPGVEVRIAPDGEVLLRGPNVFLGYFKDLAATEACLREGWLASGDLGALDADGFLTITGRKKEILITAGGKNITPANIEAALKDIPLVGQAVVIGDRRRFLSALLTLDPDAAAAFRASAGLDPQAPLHAHAEVQRVVQAGVDEVNRRFARVESVRRFTILPRELSQEQGELTPTQKVKRRVVEANWASAIDAMYAE